MKKITMLAVAVLSFFAASFAFAADAQYNYMSAKELEGKIKAKEAVQIVDIQVEAEYGQHHIKGAVPTYSYPVKSAEDKAKLDAALPALKDSKAPVVIVCPRGAGGAERTHAYLKEKGLDASRLYILEKGQAGWDCAELTEGAK